MKLKPAPDIVAASDCVLVERIRRRERDAFAELVRRYQTLIASIAYSASGDLRRSEDLAQEAFLLAWQRIETLDKPERVRAWLGGIVRNLARATRRSSRQEPTDRAEPIEAAESLAASGEDENPARDRTIRAEEQAILWRALEAMPEVYREPLVLFYRAEKSVAEVAALLDLTEDAVKQRLARGRRILQDEVAAFVERGLSRSAPDRRFTLGVMDALPGLAVSGGGAASVAVKALAAKGAGGVVGSLLVFGVTLLGTVGGWLGLKSSLLAARDERERQEVLADYFLTNLLVVVWVASFGALVWAMARGEWTTAQRVGAIAGAMALYVVALTWLIRRSNRRRAAQRAATASDEKGGAIDADNGDMPVFEYRSTATFLGLPLVHVRGGWNRRERWRPALGWLAVGEVAVGGVALGGVSCGVISIAGLALGGVAVGGMALGFTACAGIAFGYVATGGMAFAWHFASGGIAWAREFALGGVARAAHANDALATAAAEGRPIVSALQHALTNWAWWLGSFVAAFALGFWEWWRLRRATRR